MNGLNSYYGLEVRRVYGVVANPASWVIRQLLVCRRDFVLRSINACRNRHTDQKLLLNWLNDRSFLSAEKRTWEPQSVDSVKGPSLNYFYIKINILINFDIPPQLTYGIILLNPDLDLSEYLSIFQLKIKIAIIFRLYLKTGSWGEYLGPTVMRIGSGEGSTMRNFIVCTVHLI